MVLKEVVISWVERAGAAGESARTEKAMFVAVSRYCTVHQETLT